jgi:hypothetical protein
MHLLGRSCARHKDVVALGLHAATAGRVAAAGARHSGGRLHTASERMRTAKRMWWEGKQMHFLSLFVLLALAAVLAEQVTAQRVAAQSACVFAPATWNWFFVQMFAV